MANECRKIVVQSFDEIAECVGKLWANPPITEPYTLSRQFKSVEVALTPHRNLKKEGYKNEKA